MLKDAIAFITFSVNDLEKAKHFYGERLGLGVDDSMPGMLSLELAGGSKVMLYEKKNHQPATYTVLNFPVDDLDKAMDELKEKGITFEQYDQPDIKTNEKGVVDYGVMKIAFFNDPAGNNHAVLQMTDKHE